MELQVISHSSPLGDWRMTLGRPPMPLCELAPVLWDVAGVTHYASEAILPTGGIELLFNLGDDQFLLNHHNPDERTRYDTVWVSGLQQQHLIVQSMHYSHLVGVRLTPPGAWRFFGMPLHELTDQVLDLDLILGRSLLDLREQLANHPEPVWRLRRLFDFVGRRMAGGPAIHAAVSSGLMHLGESHGQCTVKTLLQETGLSQKHLIRKFQQQVGLSPKRYAQLLKFQHAACMLQNARTIPDLSQMALACGYYDQAYFNRDFRRFAGASPTAFLRLQLPDEVAVAMRLE